MLKNTFCHVEGISEDTEKMLWENGICCWEDFETRFNEISFLSESKLNKIKSEIFYSLTSLNENNLSYFKNKLPQKELFRLVNYGKIAYVDIETTGLSKYTNEITLIGVYDGKNPSIFISGENLNDAIDYLKQFDIIVSFNGKTFDLPFIEHKFNYKFDNVIHLDLRYLLKEMGLAGGLKLIEKAVGLTRDDEIANVDGFEAVRLWKSYKMGNADSLRKLLKYNEEDIVNLKFLLEYYLKYKYSFMGDYFKDKNQDLNSPLL